MKHKNFTLGGFVLRGSCLGGFCPGVYVQGVCPRTSFRILNPKLCRHCYIKNNVRSRINRIYINETENGKIQNTNFSKTLWDDHKMYRINIFDNIDIGPRQWMLNIKFLSDKEFSKTLENEWMEFRK